MTKSSFHVWTWLVGYSWYSTTVRHLDHSLLSIEKNVTWDVHTELDIWVSEYNLQIWLSFYMQQENKKKVMETGKAEFEIIIAQHLLISPDPAYMVQSKYLYQELYVTLEKELQKIKIKSNMVYFSTLACWGCDL